jgi:hypothetical protein
MLLKDNKLFELPMFSSSSFSGMDRLWISHNILILSEVHQREDPGEIELIAKAKDGPEEKRGHVRFVEDNHNQKNLLSNWLKQQIGKNYRNYLSQ